MSSLSDHYRIASLSILTKSQKYIFYQGIFYYRGLHDTFLVHCTPSLSLQMISILNLIIFWKNFIFTKVPSQLKEIRTCVDFCFIMITSANMLESESNIIMNIWPHKLTMSVGHPELGGLVLDMQMLLMFIFI